MARGPFMAARPDTTDIQIAGTFTGSRNRIRAAINAMTAGLWMIFFGEMYDLSFVRIRMP